MTGTPTCMTKGLDRSSSVDYAPNQDAKFSSEDDGDLLGGCQYVSTILFPIFDKQISNSYTSSNP